MESRALQKVELGIQVSPQEMGGKQNFTPDIGKSFKPFRIIFLHIFSIYASTVELNLYVILSKDSMTVSSSLVCETTNENKNYI